jgi:hypothetical protein
MSSSMRTQVQAREERSGPQLRDAHLQILSRGGQKPGAIPILGGRTGQAVFAQQARSNSALRSNANHHMTALMRWCNALLGEGSSWVWWWGSLDGI